MFVRCALALLTVLSTLFATPAVAQEVYRTVLLNVPGSSDGTEQLTAEIQAVPGLDLRDQKWFLQQVKARGMSPKKLLQRPADLRFVMSGSNIAYVLYVDHDDGTYVGRVFADDGELRDKVELGEEFGQVEAAEFRALFEKVLGIEADTVEPVEVATEAPVGAVEDVEVEAKDKDKPKERKPRVAGEPRAGLALGAGARVFKRDMTYSGSNNAVLNYQSALYPGFAVTADYALSGVEVGPSLFGIWLDVNAGFDSLATVDESVSILHLDTAAGVGLNFETLGLRLGARHVRYSLSSTEVFPSLAHTLVVLGLTTEQQFGSFILGGEVEIHPWGLYHGKAGELFGAKSSEVGFAAGIRLGYALSESLALLAGYGARVERSNFPGKGSLDFRDSHGFELVHGPELGVTWHP